MWNALQHSLFLTHCVGCITHLSLKHRTYPVFIGNLGLLLINRKYALSFSSLVTSQSFFLPFTLSFTTLVSSDLSIATQDGGYGDDDDMPLNSSYYSGLIGPDGMPLHHSYSKDKGIVHSILRNL